MNLRTFEKAGTKGPLITLITQIMDARNLRMARGGMMGGAESASPFMAQSA
ncbi:MAG: hypothetical protein LBK61_14260 [Spirochaetaceae bacterium]|nr:hypothetical protein [Spirochaetaceae bacterium]